MAELLTLEGVVAGYGSARVLHGVDLTAQEGEITVLLGANGVGKTTTLRTISGLVASWAGSILLDGTPIAGMAPERIVRLGVGVVPEAPGVFRDLSVADNLRVGAAALGRRAATEAVDRVAGMFPRIGERLGQLAGSLSGGEQRLLAIARALVASPRLLLVDEASMGLAPLAVRGVLDVLRDVRDRGVTVCMVEQNVAAVGIADRAYVMASGCIERQATGRALDALRSDVASAYLGTSR